MSLYQMDVKICFSVLVTLQDEVICLSWPEGFEDQDISNHVYRPEGRSLGGKAGTKGVDILVSHTFPEASLLTKHKYALETLRVNGMVLSDPVCRYTNWWVFRYLEGTINMGLLVSRKRQSHSLNAIADADHEGVKIQEESKMNKNNANLKFVPKGNVAENTKKTTKESASVQPATKRATPKKPTTTTPVKQSKPAPPPTKKPPKQSIPQEEGNDPDLELAKKMSLEAHQEKGEGEGDDADLE
ncbi:hypothetical protein Tco_0316749 [Tanacetum coccineum]